MNILVLGGTVFLGRHLVEVAISRGHQVTLFNRGQTNPDLFPQIEKLRGDRDGELESLIGRQWDAAIDTSGYLPHIVLLSAEFLSESVQHYTFISTISVYSDFDVEGIDESAPVMSLMDQFVEVITGETYGPLKARCEEAVAYAMPARSLVIRPGVIVGPHDPTDRFTYWIHRVARGGEILVPVPADQRVQVIDVRDLATWTLEMIEAGATGIYNATGPEGELTMQALLDACQAVSKNDATFIWVDPDFVTKKGVVPWTEIPLWTHDIGAGLMAINSSKAITAGLTFRPLLETIRDTLIWDQSRPPQVERRAGLSLQRESSLLQAWYQEQG
ncbi:MAG: epimerase [Anaerolineales bacterium]|nr:epimerase [Anaerolineales bacterium]